MADYTSEQMAAIDLFMRPHLASMPLNSISTLCDRKLGPYRIPKGRSFLHRQSSLACEPERGEIDPFRPLLLTSES